MYDVIFYSDASGNEPIAEYIRELRQKSLANYKGSIFILLHRFVKKTDKTPPMEIDQAKRLLADYIERNEE